MLVLSRKIGEKLIINDNITIVINRIAGNRVSVGIEAPDDVHVVRGELKPLILEFRSSPADNASEFESDRPELRLTRLAR